MAKLTEVQVLQIATNVIGSARDNASCDHEQDTAEWLDSFLGSAESILDGLTGREWSSWAPRQLTSSEVSKIRKTIAAVVA